MSNIASFASGFDDFITYQGEIKKKRGTDKKPVPLSVVLKIINKMLHRIQKLCKK